MLYSKQKQGLVSKLGSQRGVLSAWRGPCSRRYLRWYKVYEPIFMTTGRLAKSPANAAAMAYETKESLEEKSKSNQFEQVYILLPSLPLTQSVLEKQSYRCVTYNILENSHL